MHNENNATTKPDSEENTLHGKGI